MNDPSNTVDMSELPESTASPLEKTFKKRPFTNPNDGLMGKVPPQARQLEEAVLGAMMLDSNAVTNVLEVVHEEVFYVEAHRDIFRAMHELYHQSQPVDLLTVTEKLRSMGKLDLAGGAYYLTQLTNRVASAANVEYHSRIIAEKFILRELIRIAGETGSRAFDETTDVFELLDSTEKALFEITERNLKRKTLQMNGLLKLALKDLESRKDLEEGLTGVPSGIPDLDRYTSGWQKSDLVIVAARPGMGKTAFALSVARNAAVDFKRPVAFFSQEMSALQLVNRLISAEAELPAEKLRRGNLAGYEWQQLTTKTEKLSNAKLFIDDTPAISIYELRAKCRRLVHQHKVEMIVIDYLQLMTSGISNNRGVNREQEISTISRSLKSIAKELNIPVIALSQLNRSVDRSSSKRPVLSDLRESGAIEQDADMVLFLYRAEYYNLDTDEEGNSTKGIAEIIISKHRNGANGTVKARFVDKFAKYEKLDSNQYKPLGQESGAPATITIGSKINEMPPADDEFFDVEGPPEDW